MKTKTKALALALCAVLLAAVSVFATVAFLKSSDSVTNTFTVGKVAIALDESRVDEYGIVEEGAERVKENTYKLIPGHTYTKDPTVHVAAGSEASWLFIKVENGLSGIEADGNTIASQIKVNGWTEFADATGVYYRKVDAAEADTDYLVFNEFTIAAAAVVESCAGAEIVITAYAIQADGFDTPEAAWDAGQFGA